MSLRDALRNLEATRRRHGPAAAARLAWSALSPGTRHYQLFGLSPPYELLPPAGPSGAHRFRLATLEEIAAGNGIWSSRDCDAMRRGDRCLLQWDGERLAGYTWAAGSSLVCLTEGVHLNLPDDAAYIYKAYTAPEYRGHGFQARRGLELLRLLEPEGRRRLFAYVERENFDSLKGIHKTGYERVGSLVVARKRGEVRVTLRVSSAYWSDLRRA
jgi:ribosomal protein S18 acetylase RimI-like enzyme